MDRNDLFAWTIGSGTMIILAYIIMDTAKVIGWGAP